MLETKTSVPDGWYPDPFGGLMRRRWSAGAWTHEAEVTQFGAGQMRDSKELQELNPPELGWGGVAFAIHSALVDGRPVAVHVVFPDGSELNVDAVNHTYAWARDHGELTAVETPFTITFSQTVPGAQANSKNLDGLLWRISRVAYASRLAPWLREDDLYKMQRWPNLTTILPELDDMRQAAMLANGMFTTEELAGFSDRAIAPTRTLINALSLMNTLRVAVPRDSGAVQVRQAATPFPPQPARKQGLFQRLRSKLGL